MRIVIVSPPKSGANRLRCLLASSYRLQAIDARDAPSNGNPEAFAKWIETLPDNCVTHSDFPFHAAATAAVGDLGVTFIGIVRHPFDLFVSNREVQSNRTQRLNRRGRNHEDSGDHQASLSVAQHTDPMSTFANELQSLVNWTADTAITLRYEDILVRPETVLAEVSEIVGSLESDRIAHAVLLCPAEQRIVSSGNRGVRMSEIQPGAWRTEIDPAMLLRLQERFAEAVSALGYELE